MDDVVETAQPTGQAATGIHLMKIVLAGRKFNLKAMLKDLYVRRIV